MATAPAMLARLCSPGGRFAPAAVSNLLGLSRGLSGAAAPPPLRFCVVGSGPAGMYTVDKLLKKYEDGVRVDVVDRLPTPFGLVRSGVAPDHPDTKNVTNQFNATLADPRVQLFGNVRVGRDVSLAELRRLYNGVVLAYGAESDRKLGIPGEDTPGVLSAREFVWWYNGHPDARSLKLDLTKVERVAVCGIGNVALDVARVLLRPPSQLAHTDVATHALAQLQATAGSPRHVHLVVRRGPVQAACTPKELKELLTECSVTTVMGPGALAVSEADQAEMKATRMKRRVYDMLTQAAEGSGKGGGSGEGDGKGKEGKEQQRVLHFNFYRSPVEVVSEPDGAGGKRIKALRTEVTELRSPAPGKPAVAVGTGRFEEIPCQLVLVSIGYRSLALEGAPFDAKAGVIPNFHGKVLRAPGAGPSDAEPGLYVCGWLKRGPSGIIGTNLVDADDTVETIGADFPPPSAAVSAATPVGSEASRDVVAGGDGLRELLASRAVAVVDAAAWRRLDGAEVEAGRARGSSRSKVTDVAEMLAKAQQGAQQGAQQQGVAGAAA